MHLCMLWGLLVVLNQNTWHNKCHQSDYYTHNMEINVYWKEVSKKRAFSLYYDDMSYYFDIITYVQENPKWINPANPLCPTEHHSCFYLPVMVLPVCSLTFPSLYHHVSDAPRHDPRFTLVSKDYQARQRTSAVHGWWWFAPDKWAIACWASLTCRLRVLTVQLDLQPRHRSGSVRREGGCSHCGEEERGERTQLCQQADYWRLLSSACQFTSVLSSQLKPEFSL